MITVEPKLESLLIANETLEAEYSRIANITDEATELHAMLAKLTEELEEADAQKKDALDTVEALLDCLGLCRRLRSRVVLTKLRVGGVEKKSLTWGEFSWVMFTEEIYQ